MRCLASFGVLLLLLSGCAAPIMKAENDTPVLPPPSPDIEVLAPGDTIEVIYTRTNAAQSGPYRLQIGDTVSVDVADQPDLSAKNLRVLPDGRISMPQVGSVPAAGRSVEQVASLITTGLEQKKVPQPDVVVTVDTANQRLEQFMRSAAPDNLGSRLEVLLSSDELLALPLIAPLPAVGRPLSAVREDIADAYQRVFGDQLNVTVNLHQQAEPQVYVWGEVGKPGIVPIKSRMNAAMVVAAAGGPTGVGDPAHVLVVRFRPDGGFYHWTVDLTSVESAERSPGFDIPLRNRDLVFVSRTPIGDVNKFVDLYVRQNIPLPLGLGFTP